MNNATQAPPTLPNTRDRVAPPAAGPVLVPPGTQKGRGRRYDDEPTIKGPTAAEKAAAAARKANVGNYDPTKFWTNYFQHSNETPMQVFVTVVQLVQAKEIDDAEAAISCYINTHRKQAESWMYQWLVKLLEMKKKPDSEIRKALGYAAYLAKRSRNFNDLYRVADMLVLRNIDGPIGEGPTQTSVAELIDLAAEIDPTHAYPPMMSIDLAVRTRDPKRFQKSVDQLLALGWPGNDDVLRKNARKQADALAKSLREDGRTDEAEAMLAHLPEVEARDLYLRLTWKGEADIDLQVTEPLGAVAKFDNPRTVFGGAILKNGYGNHPEEVYACPRAFAGDYTARVEVIYNDPDKPVAEAQLEVIQHEGTDKESRQTHTIKLADPKPVVIKLSDGRRTQVLPYIAPPERPEIRPTPPAAVNPAAKPKVATPKRP